MLSLTSIKEQTFRFFPFSFSCSLVVLFRLTSNEYRFCVLLVGICKAHAIFTRTSVCGIDSDYSIEKTHTHTKLCFVFLDENYKLIFPYERENRMLIELK